MKRILIATVLLLVACAPVGAPKSKVSNAVDTRHCADIVAHAFASPSSPVEGVMQCFSSSLIDQANASGVYDDHDFMAQIAAVPPVYTSSTYCGVAHNGDFVYEMTADGNARNGRLALHVDRTSGLVGGINTNDGDACPQGLR